MVDGQRNQNAYLRPTYDFELHRTRSLGSHGHCRSCFPAFLCASVCHPHVFEMDRRTERGITIVLQFDFFERNSSCFLGQTDENRGESRREAVWACLPAASTTK